MSITNTDTQADPSSSSDPTPSDKKSSDDDPKDQGGDSGKDSDSGKAVKAVGATAAASNSEDVKFSGQAGADTKGVSGLRLSPVF